MATADESGARPRVLVRVSRGMVRVRCDVPLELTVIDEDVEVRCDEVSHLVSGQDMDEMLRYFASFRTDRLFCEALNRGE
jgi:hypothetical protein